MRFLLGWSVLAFVMATAAHAEAPSTYSRNHSSSQSILRDDTTHVSTRPCEWHNILQIFTKTQSAIKLRNLPVAKSIQLTRSLHASAFVYGRENIRLSETLIETLQTEDQLAFAISHEMAHIALGHGTDSATSEELAADAFAASLLVELGMDACASTAALEALQRREPTYREPLEQRIQHLKEMVLSDCSSNDSSLLALRESPIAHPFY